VVRISVAVKPNSKEASVEKTGERTFLVRLKSPPKDGKANAELVGILGKYFGVPKSRITISRGVSGRNKTIDIE